jgi:hypothetical protein
MRKEQLGDNEMRKSYRKCKLNNVLNGTAPSTAFPLTKITI